MKKYLVHVINEQEITMEIFARNKEHAMSLIECDEWASYMEDSDTDETDVIVNIKTTKGFKIKDKPWKIKSIKEKKI